MIIRGRTPWSSRLGIGIGGSTRFFIKGWSWGGAPAAKVLLSWDSKGIRRPCWSEFHERLLPAGYRVVKQAGGILRRSGHLSGGPYRTPVDPGPGCGGGVGVRVRLVMAGAMLEAGRARRQLASYEHEDPPSHYRTAASRYLLLPRARKDQVSEC